MFTLPQDSNGWSILPISPSALEVYVSSSSGSDTNNGLSSSAPFKTLAKACAVTKNNTSRQNIIYLKSGDTWLEGLGSPPTGSLSYPYIVTSYGTGSRPCVSPITPPPPSLDTATGQLLQGNWYVVIEGIEFDEGTHDPAKPGFSLASGGGVGVFVNGGNFILIENCLIHNFNVNINAQGSSSHQSSDLTIRRNVICDSFNDQYGDGRPQGIYIIDYNNVLIEENILDHNGWVENDSLDLTTNRTIYSHNVYIKETCQGVIFQNNISSRASSYGGQFRSGGSVLNNLFIENAPHTEFGLVEGAGASAPSGVTGTISGNVFWGNADIMGVPESSCIQGANINPTAEFSNNLFLNGNNANSTSYQFALMLTYGTNAGKDLGITGLNIHDNIAYNWDNSFCVADVLPTGMINNTTLNNNLFKNVYGINRVDVQSSLNNPNFVNPNVSLAGYSSKVSGAGTESDFFTQMRLQSKNNWNVNYTAGGVNSYFQGGFAQSENVVPVPPPVPIVVPIPTPTPTPTLPPVVIKPTPIPTPVIIPPVPKPVTVYNAKITKLSLIDAGTQKANATFANVVNNTNLLLTKFNINEFNFQVTTSPATVGSLKVQWDAHPVEIFSGATKPYSVFGYSSGKYLGDAKTVGIHKLSITPYSAAGATGISGTPFNIQLTIT